MRGGTKVGASAWTIATIVLAVFASPSGAEWLPPVDISAASEHTGNPHVVLDSAGNATAVWDRWNGADTVVEAAYRPAGEGWGAPQDLSEPELEGEIVPGAHNASSPQIAVDRNGNVTVLWERYGGTKIILQSVERPAGGSWTEPVDVGEVALGPAPEPWIAVDWEGNATAVWKQGGVIESAFKSFAHEWEAPEPISGTESYVPQAAMDARGDTTAVWMHFDGAHYVVESAYRPEAGEWEAPTLVSQEGEEGGNPHVSLDAKGDSLVVWRGEDKGKEFVRAAYRPLGGSWGTPANVSNEGEQVQELRDAVDPDGNAIAVWAGNSGEAGGHEIVRAAFKPAAGAWETPVKLSADGGNSFPSDVVFDTGGNAALVWQRSDGSSDVVQAAYRPAGEEWESAVDLSEEGKQSFDPVVVLDAPGDATAADGNATAVWVTETTGSCGGGEGGGCASNVQAAGYDPEGLPEPELELPAEGTVGEPVEISTPTKGLFAPLLEFGDGESVADTEASHVYEEAGEYEVNLGGAEVLGYRASVVEKIKIVAGEAGEPVEPEFPQGEDEPSRPGGGGGDPVAAGSAALPTSPDAWPSARCLAAKAARASARHRLRGIAAKLDGADGAAEIRRLSGAERKQAAAVRRATRHVAAAC